MKQQSLASQSVLEKYGRKSGQAAGRRSPTAYRPQRGVGLCHQSDTGETAADAAGPPCLLGPGHDRP
jgi:hypothetical protein